MLCPMAHFVIMGVGRVGISLAHALEDSGHTVAVIDQDDRAFRKLRPDFSGKKVTGHGFIPVAGGNDIGLAVERLEETYRSRLVM